MILKILFIILIVALIISPIIIGDYIQTFYHETVHKTVYQYSGIKSTITINPFFRGGYTTNIDDNTTLAIDGGCDKECKNFHLLTEIVGYHNSALIINLWMLGLFLALIIMIR